MRAVSACRASCAGPAMCRPARSKTASSPASTGSRPSLPPPATRTSWRSCKKGKKIGDRTYKNHLDGYNQMDMITGKGPSARHEIFYFTESNLAAVRIDDFKYRFIDQPGGWIGTKDHVDVPVLTNLRLDPFERTGWPENGTKNGSQEYFAWFQYEFWRFVFVQQQVGKLAMTAIEYPAHAEGRKLQPRCRESEDRGSHEGPATVVELSIWRAARKGRPPSCRQSSKYMAQGVAETKAKPNMKGGATMKRTHLAVMRLAPATALATKGGSCKPAVERGRKFG